LKYILSFKILKQKRSIYKKKKKKETQFVNKWEDVVEKKK